VTRLAASRQSACGRSGVSAASSKKSWSAKACARSRTCARWIPPSRVASTPLFWSALCANFRVWHASTWRRSLPTNSRLLHRVRSASLSTTWASSPKVYAPT
jgi:hypothetical protein